MDHSAQDVQVFEARAPETDLQDLRARLAAARLPAGLAIGYTATAVAMLSFLGGPAELTRQGGGEGALCFQYHPKAALGCEVCLVATMLALVMLTVFVVAREQ